MNALKQLLPSSGGRPVDTVGDSAELMMRGARAVIAALRTSGSEHVHSPSSGTYSRTHTGAA